MLEVKGEGWVYGMAHSCRVPARYEVSFRRNEDEFMRKKANTYSKGLTVKCELDILNCACSNAYLIQEKLALHGKDQSSVNLRNPCGTNVYYHQ